MLFGETMQGCKQGLSALKRSSFLVELGCRGRYASWPGPKVCFNAAFVPVLVFLFLFVRMSGEGGRRHHPQTPVRQPPHGECGIISPLLRSSSPPWPKVRVFFLFKM